MSRDKRDNGRGDIPPLGGMSRHVPRRLSPRLVPANGTIQSHGGTFQTPIHPLLRAGPKVDHQALHHLDLAGIDGGLLGAEESLLLGL